MRGPDIAMSTQVTMTLLSGAVALIVALLGIAGAIAAQLVATRRAYANSLALFDRQHAQEEASRKQQREEDIRREDAHRFADQRRAVYARFLQLADETRRARGNAALLLDIAGRHEGGKGEDGQGGDPLKQRLAERADEQFDANYDRAEQASDQLRGLVAEIDLLGSADVRATARELYLAVGEFVGRRFAPARDAFVGASRRELGVAAGDLHAPCASPLDYRAGRRREDHCYCRSLLDPARSRRPARRGGSRGDRWLLADATR